MHKLIRNVSLAIVAGVVGAVLAITALPVAGQAQGYRPPRLADGHPDLNGIWQTISEANWDIQMHVARPALAMREGPYGLVPDTPVLALGAVGAVPPGVGIVDGDELPYRPEALTTKRENQQNWISRDPEIKCYLPGVPRATYMPYPFQILQSSSQLLIAYEATIEDAKTFTRPWKMSMALYRRQEKNAQLMDFKCPEFVEELLYGAWRKTPLAK